MNLLQHHNYVVVFQDGRIKIGRTGNPRRRLKELGRDGRIYGYDMGRPVSSGVALHTESHIRRTLRSHAMPETLEWFEASKYDALVVVKFTAETQSTLEAAGV